MFSLHAQILQESSPLHKDNLALRDKTNSFPWNDFASPNLRISSQGSHEGKCAELTLRWFMCVFSFLMQYNKRRNSNFYATRNTREIPIAWVSICHSSEILCFSFVCTFKATDKFWYLLSSSDFSLFKVNFLYSIPNPCGIADNFFSMDVDFSLLILLSQWMFELTINDTLCFNQLSFLCLFVIFFG